MSLKKVEECVKRNKSFLITTHTSPEGDALGSELAFYRLLRKLGKKAVIINEDPVPYGYDFLPNAQIIKKYKDNLKKIDFDCFVVLDCSDLGRTGEVYRMNKERKAILNIDHHISNINFGDVNWVEPKASSCSEIVYQVYKKLGVPLDEISATYLYTGILTDTGSFHYSNTTSLTHKIASELLSYNSNITQIYKFVYENIPYQDMQLLARILPRMQKEAEGRIVWFQIKKEMLKNKKLSFDLSEHILTFGRAVKDAQVVVLFKENLGIKDEIRVNFRSQSEVDVNKIAQAFGGGGHKSASGATVKGKIDSVRRKVFGKIKESLK